jgi:hypothetical protein
VVEQALGLDSRQGLSREDIYYQHGGKIRHITTLSPERIPGLKIHNLRLLQILFHHLAE